MSRQDKVGHGPWFRVLQVGCSVEIFRYGCSSGRQTVPWVGYLTACN